MDQDQSARVYQMENDDDYPTADDVKVSILLAGVVGLLLFAILAAEQVFLGGESFITYLFG